MDNYLLVCNFYDKASYNICSDIVSIGGPEGEVMEGSILIVEALVLKGCQNHDKDLKKIIQISPWDTIFGHYFC